VKAVRKHFGKQLRFVYRHFPLTQVHPMAEPAAEAAVRRVDDQRIELLKGIFEGFGYDPDHAFIRARITYFHQVGYQAMEIIESREHRTRLRPLYREALVGLPPGAAKPKA